MAIQYVGGKTNSRLGATTTTSMTLSGLAGGIGTAAAAGDLVVLTLVTGTALARHPSMSTASAGWTEVGTLYSDGTTYTACLSVSYKIMGSTPDSSVSIPSTGHVDDGQAYILQVFRGVDSTTPMDAVAAGVTGTGTGRANPAAITPNTPGAWITVSAAAGNSAQGGGFAFSDLTNVLIDGATDTNDAVAGVGIKTDWVSGAFDPATATSGPTATAAAWAAYTLALKPAAAPATQNLGASGANVASGTAAMALAENMAAGGSVAAAGTAALSVTAAGGGLASLVDTFTGTTLDTAKWTAFVSSANSHVTQNGTLVIDHYGSDTNGGATPYPMTGVKSTQTYDITGQAAFVKMVPYTSTSSDFGMMYQSFGLWNETNDEGVGFDYLKAGGGRLYFRIWNSFTTSWTDTDPAAYLTYDPVNHAWLRVRESAGTIYWDTAPDNAGQPGTWTNRASKAHNTFTNFDSIASFVSTSKVLMATRTIDAGMLDSYITADGTFDTFNGGSGGTAQDLAAAGTDVVTGTAALTAAAPNPNIDAIAEIKSLRIPSGPYLGGYEIAPNGKLNWYFANLALAKMTPYLNSTDLETYIRVYLDLYISKCDPTTFVIQDVNFTVGRADPTQYTLARSDSDDSYAATFLSLVYAYYQAVGTSTWVTTNLALLKSIAYNNIALQVKANGLCRVYQSPDPNGIGYLMDNAEVYRGLRDFSALLTAIGDADDTYYGSFANSVAAGIGSLWDATALAWRPSDAHTVAETTFYPGTTCQVFTQAFGVSEQSGHFTDAYSYLNTNTPNWPTLSYDAFPWAVLGYTAYQRGDTTKVSTQRQSINDLFVNDRAKVTINELGWYLAYTPPNAVNLEASGLETVTGTAVLRVGNHASYIPNPQSGSGYTFGSHLESYGRGIALTASQTTVDNYIKTHYNNWKAARLVTSIATIPGGNAIQFSDVNYLTVSEGMGYGMLIVVMMAGHDANARTVFDALLTTVRARPAFNVTRDLNNSGRGSDAWVGNYMMEWKLNADGSSINDGYPAPDGDLDIALALLMADRQWGSTGTWNYAQEAADTIYALKVWNFKSQGYPEYKDPGTSRVSDWMYQHLRAFAEHTGDTYWTATAIPKLQNMTEYLQNNYSASAGLVPDFINSATTTTPAPASAGQGDPGLYGNEGDYYWNSCRVPMRWGLDWLMYGSATTKTQTDRITNFFKGKYVAAGTNDVSAAMTAVDCGYHLDGTTIAGGDSAAFMGPVMVGCMTDSGYQSFMDSLWSWMTSHQITAYYDGELQLMSELIVSNNWFSPRTVSSGPAGQLGANGTVVATGSAALNVVGSGGGTTTASLTDDFTAASLDTGKWTTFVSSANSTVSAVSGQAVIDHYGNDNNGGATPYPTTGLRSANALSLQGSEFYMRLYPYVSSASDWGMAYNLVGYINPTGDEGVAFGYMKAGGGRLYFKIFNSVADFWAEADPAAYIAYSATDHAWLRIREAGGTVYWDTAPDSGSGTPGAWTNRASATVAAITTNFDNPSAWLTGSRITALFIPTDAGLLDSYITTPMKIDGVNTSLVSSSAVNLAASGAGVATGSAQLTANLLLAASGGVVALGSANSSLALSLAAAGAGVAVGTAGLLDAKNLAAAGAAQATGSATPTGAAPLAATGAGVATGTANLSDSKNLAAAGAGQATGTAGIAKTDNLAAAGAGQATGTADILQGSVNQFNAPGTVQATGTANLSHGVPLAAAGADQAEGTAGLAKADNLAAAGSGQVTGGAAATQNVPLAAAGADQATGTADLNQLLGKQMAATGTVQATGTAGLDNKVNLAADGAGQATGTADAVRGANLAANGKVQATGTIAAQGTTPLAADGTVEATGGANLARDATMQATGSDQATGTASMSHVTPLAAAGQDVVTGTANLNDAKNLSAAGADQATGTAQPVAQLPLAAAGQDAATGTANLQQQVPLAAAGQDAATGTANATQAKPLAADGAVQATGSASATQVKPLAADGAVQATGTASMLQNVDKPLAADGTAEATGAATPAVDRAMAADGVVQATGTADLSQSFGKQMAATGTVQVTGTADAIQDKPLTADGTGQATGSADMLGSISMRTDGTVQVTGTADLARSAPLAGAGSSTVTGAFAIAVEKALIASAAGNATGTVSMSHALNLNVLGTAAAEGNAALNNVISMIAAGGGEVTATAVMAKITQLVADGNAAASGGAELLMATPLSANGFGVSTGSPSLQKVVQMAAAALSDATGNATLKAAFRLDAAGAATATGSAGLGVSKIMVAVGVATANAAFALAVDKALDATATSSATGTASLTKAVPMSAAGYVQATGQADTLGVVSLGAAGAGVVEGGATLQKDVSLGGAGLGQVTGTAGLQKSGFLAAAGAAQATAMTSLRKELNLTAGGVAQVSATAAAELNYRSKARSPNSVVVPADDFTVTIAAADSTVEV